MYTIKRKELRFWNSPYKSYQHIFMIINFSQPLHDNLEINLAIMENIIIKTYV